MRIALLDAFPNLEATAEREFAARFKIAAARLGINTVSAVTSDDLAACAPDLVIATHEYSRKLTSAPTLGLVWSPTAFFRDDPFRTRSLLSYDGYLVGSDGLRQYLDDLQFGTGVRKPTSAGLFLPTAACSEERAFPRNTAASLCYIGVHWDGRRHDEVLGAIAARSGITFYGPEEKWRHFSGHYAGALPFDGGSVQCTIARHGIALCLHKDEHRVENTPSMRIFETLSVGAIAICDHIPFATEHLSEIVYFIDLDKDPQHVAKRLAAIIEEVNADPEGAAARGERGRRWFEEHWSLESRIRDVLLPLHQSVLTEGAFRAVISKRRAWFMKPLVPGPKVEIVVRTGGRPLNMVDRALDSVAAANSRECELGVILVDYAGRPELPDMAAKRAASGLPVRYMRSSPTGFRSTQLWEGLRAARAPYVANLDDDDTVFPNHYRQLYRTLASSPNAHVAYSGAIRFEEDGPFAAAPNFEGPRRDVVAERRDVQFLDRFDLPRLARLDNYVQSNSWLGRTGFVAGLLGEDPELEVIEDVYLYLLMAARSPFAFTGSATAVWHWRSQAGDNSMLAVDRAKWAYNYERVRHRLRHHPFATCLTLAQLQNPRDGESGSAVATRPPPAPISMGDVLEGGIAIARHAALTGFHGVEDVGAWSRTEVAWIDLQPAPELVETGGMLTLRFAPAYGLQKAKWYEVGREDAPPIRSIYTNGDERQVDVPIVAGELGRLRLIFRVAELLQGGVLSEDMRNLGLLLKGIAVFPSRP